MLGFIIPTYSALCKSRKRIPLFLWNSALKLTAGIRHKRVAIDSTGFSKTNPSFHYIKRVDRKIPTRSYIKQSTLFDIEKKKIIDIRIRSKPRHDCKDAEYLIKRNHFEELFGDSSYDAEFIHELCFELGIKTIIKSKKMLKEDFIEKNRIRIIQKRNIIREV
jgi:hypothetical protein